MPATTRSAKKRKMAATTLTHETLPSVNLPETKVPYGRLCPVCDRFEREAICQQSYETKWSRFIHHATFADMVDAAFLGCQLCILLEETYLNAQLAYPGIEDRTSAFQRLLQSDSILLSHVCDRTSSESWHNFALELQTHNSQDEASGDQFVGCWSIELFRIVTCRNSENSRWEQRAGILLQTDASESWFAANCKLRC